MNRIDMDTSICLQSESEFILLDIEWVHIRGNSIPCAQHKPPGMKGSGLIWEITYTANRNCVVSKHVCVQLKIHC